MTKELTDSFVGYITRCLVESSGADKDKVEQLVRKVLVDAPKQPSLRQLEDLQKKIEDVLGQHDQIDLVTGGATKIKGYVFEAPKLPEIRGASTLLDWVNEVELPALWGARDPSEWYGKGIIYAGGGSFLALAPFDTGEALARRIERAYTQWTLTANSVAEARSFRLIELRYGRNPLGYWIDEFLRDWQIDERRQQLELYYYGEDKDTPQRRFFRRKTFGELMTLLAGDLNCRRDERAFDEGPAFFPRQPWDERCDSSDLRPALIAFNIEDAGRRLSPATALKAVVGRLVKNRDNPRAWELARHPLLQVEDQARQIVEAERGWDDHWRRYLKDHPESAYARLPHALEARPASDVHQIGAASGRRIGMIYADGNNVGRLMATLATPQDYASVSAILSDATHKAVFDGLARHLQPQRARREETWLEAPADFVHPFEILTIGGDDLLLLVPGSCALDIALTIAQSFERRIVDAFDVLKGELKELSLPPCTSIDTRSRYQLDRVVQLDQDGQLAELRTLKPLLGLSAGVVVAQEGAPIFFLRNLVDDLLKSAKKKASEQAKTGYNGGAVDFMVMKSITMVTDTIGEFRKQALEHDSDDELRRLYARPYAWHELAGLLGTVRVLREVRLPRSQLYHLGETLEAALHRGLNASMLEYLFARTRMRREHSDALALHVERAWHAPEETAMRLPPWMERTVEVKDRPRRCRETIWLDMLEIYDLLEADKEPADGQD